MKTIYTSNCTTFEGLDAVIKINEPETGRIYGYVIQRPEQVGTTAGQFGTYIRGFDELTNDEIIANIIKRSGVTIK